MNYKTKKGDSLYDTNIVLIFCFLIEIARIKVQEWSGAVSELYFQDLSMNDYNNKYVSRDASYSLSSTSNTN